MAPLERKVLKAFRNTPPERRPFWVALYPADDPFWDSTATGDGVKAMYAHLDSIFQGAFKVKLFSKCAGLFELLVRLGDDRTGEFENRLLYYNKDVWRLERIGWRLMLGEDHKFSEFKNRTFEEMREHIRANLLKNMAGLNNIYIRNFNNIGCEAFVTTESNDFVLTYFSDDVWKLETMAAYAMSTDRNLAAFGR